MIGEAVPFPLVFLSFHISAKCILPQRKLNDQKLLSSSAGNQAYWQILDKMYNMPLVSS